MPSKLRTAGAIVVGFVLANVVMVAVSAANGWLCPEIARAVAENDRVALAAAIARTPGAVGAFVVTLAAWALGSIAGGYAAARIERSGSLTAPLAFGGLFMLGGILNNLAFPPPSWFWAATLLVFVPPALAGARIARRSALTPPRA